MLNFTSLRCCQQLQQQSGAYRQLIRASLVLALLVFTAPAWPQPEDDYLKALDKASGKKDTSSASDSASENLQGKLTDTNARYEMESTLAQSYPEEFAVYQKLNVAAKNDVIAEFESTQGKADATRMMKVINKIGLLINTGDGDL